MMRRAWTAVGLSCVVVATTVAGIEAPSVVSKSRAVKSTATKTPAVDVDRTLPTDFDDVMKEEALQRLLNNAVNRNAPNSVFAGKSNQTNVIFNFDKLAEVMSEPARSEDIRPAIVIPKKPTNQLRIPMDLKTGTDRATGRLKFKFTNELKARASLVPGDRLLSLTGADLGHIERIIAKYGGTVRQLIQKSPQDIVLIENQAFQTSNRIQPDLSSMMVVEFPTKDLESLLELARTLNNEDSIEWVSIESKMAKLQEDVAGCIPDNPDDCQVPSRVEDGDRPNGGPLGDGVYLCWNSADNPITMSPNAGVVPGFCNPDPGCEMEDSQCIYGCNDAGCCNQVGAILPYCIEEDSPRGWDATCAAVANLICSDTKYATPPGVYDPCLSLYEPTFPPVLNFSPNPVFDNARAIVLGPCTEAQTFAGCNDSLCCVTICIEFPACCNTQWDIACANHALSDLYEDACARVDDQPATPDFTVKMAKEAFPNAVPPITVDLPVGAQAWMIGQPMTNRQNPPNGPGNLGPNARYETPDIHSVINYQWSPTPDTPTTPPEPPGFVQGVPLLDSSFLQTGFIGGGFDVPAVERLTGILWANYGSGGQGVNVVLDEPTKVWLYGREFELVNSASGCRGVDQAYDCIECYHNDPTLLDGRYMGDLFPHFVEGASTIPASTGLQPTSMLCATGEVLNGGVIEFAAYVNHEEFICAWQDNAGNCGRNPLWPAGFTPPSFKQPRVNSEPGQTVLLTENSVNSPPHGTACLGIMVAGDNNFGVRGMASEGQGWFFPTVSIEEGERLETAIASAIQYMGPGSVINMSIGPGGGDVVTTDPAIYALAALASDSLIVVCESAGNDGEEVTGEAGEGSGAIIVGAQSPGARLNANPGSCDFGTQSRMATCFWASNWSEDGLIPVCAWGTSVATTGYGDAYKGRNNPSPGGPELERNELRSYSAPVPGNNGAGGFSGTSAASPQIAGVAMWMQGFADTFYGQFLTSAQVRAVLSSAAAETCSSGVGNDFDLCWDYDPDQQLHPIGGMPSMYDCALNILVRLGADFSGKIKIYTGRHVGGNTFSLGELDGNTFRIRSEMRSQGSGPGNLAYLGSGGTVDFGILFTTGIPSDDVFNATIDIDCFATGAGGDAGPGLVLMIPWVMNNVSNRYTPLSVEFLTGATFNYGVDLGEYFSPQTYFTDNGTVDLRIYTLSLGYMGAPSYLSVWDRVQLTVNAPEVPNDP